MTEINPSTDAEKLIGGFITSQDYDTVKQKRRRARARARQILTGLLQHLHEMFKVFFFFFMSLPLRFEPPDCREN